MLRDCWLAMRWFALSGAVVAALSCGDRDAVAPSGSAPAHVSPQVSGRAGGAQGAAAALVVTLAGAERSDFTAHVRALGGQVERRHPEAGIVVVRGLSAGAAATLAARPDVARVDPDITLQWIPPSGQMVRVFAPAGAPRMGSRGQGADQSDAELFPVQWNMRVIEAAAAWHATPAGTGRMVCVLDTGVDPDHVELAGRIALERSASFVQSEPTIQDFNAHGTFVASIIASNGVRIASVASGSRLCAVKVLGTSGTGTFADLIAGILFAVHAGADVINMSLGAYVDLKDPGVLPLVHALQRAIDFAARRGVVVVAAAGNEGVNLDMDGASMREIPAQLDHVISVGATAPFNEQTFDRLASYSDFGSRTGIALVAPGGDLVTGGSIFDLVLGACSHTQVTLPFRCQTTYVLSGSGTSFASPHVAGAAAVVASQLGERARVARIADCLLGGADVVGPRGIFGAGRLNVASAAACTHASGHHRHHANQ